MKLSKEELKAKVNEIVTDNEVAIALLEVRVMVIPEKVNDEKCVLIARDIKDRIENELTYPGQIKVTVIREMRASETAK